MSLLITELVSTYVFEPRTSTVSLCSCFYNIFMPDDEKGVIGAKEETFLLSAVWLAQKMSVLLSSLFIYWYILIQRFGWLYEDSQPLSKDIPHNCQKATQTSQNSFKIYQRLYGRFPKKSKDFLSREIQSKDVLIIHQVKEFKYSLREKQISVMK